MRTFFLLSALLALLANLALAQKKTAETIVIPEEVKVLTQKYTEALAVAEAPLHKLRDAYLNRVGILKDEAQAEGELERVLELQNELKSVLGGAEPGKDSSFETLASLQATFHQHKTLILPRLLNDRRKIEETYLEYMEVIVEKFTRQGDLELALALSEMRDGSTERLGEWVRKGASLSSSYDPFAHFDWEKLGRLIEDDKLIETDHVGGNPQGNATTRDLPEEPSLLIGFDLHIAPFGGEETTVRKIVPLFRSQKDRLFEGTPRANANGKTKRRVLAKNGYVVTGITTQSGAGVRQIKFTFSKLDGMRADLRDSYETDFYGDWEGGRVASLSTEGKLPVGIDGWVGLGTGEFWLLTIDSL